MIKTIKMAVFEGLMQFESPAVATIDQLREWVGPIVKELDSWHLHLIEGPLPERTRIAPAFEITYMAGNVKCAMVFPTMEMR